MDPTAKVALAAPREDTYLGAYRAQAASGLRIDAFPAGVPALLAAGCRPFGELPAATEPAVAESDDTAGGFAE